jgi:hypothetical protein
VAENDTPVTPPSVPPQDTSMVEEWLNDPQKRKILISAGVVAVVVIVVLLLLLL